jgi:cell division protein FtsI (penicillin-binding protein 3)
MAVVFCFVMIAVCYRLLDLTVLSPEGDTRPLAVNLARNHLATGRADITDRHGELIATTLMTFSLFANPQKILDAKEAAHKLALTFPHLKEEELLRRLSSDKTFVWIQRHLTPTQQAKVLELGLPGIEFIRDYRRVYPQSHLVSHVVGFTDIDNRGLAGIEKGMDERLRTNPEPLVLSIDLSFQHIVRDELLKGIKEFGCMGGSGTILDFQTGEILAMVSLPDFNPNQPLKSTEEERFNKTTLGIYELGSVLKVVNTALGLESGAVTLTTRFNTAEPIRVGRFTITDYKVPPGTYTVAEIFTLSSNRGSVRIALAAGTEKQKEFFRKLGYMEPIKLEIPEIGQPRIPKNWRESTTITASYGYGFSISPLQLLVGIATIVGDGRRIHPTLLKGGTAHQPRERVVSEQTARRVLYLMRQVVLEGTARKAAIPGFFVAGKTGTVNWLEKGGYNKQRVATSFVAVLGEDANSPRYIMIMRLYNPQRLSKTHGLNSAGWNVVPVTRRIMERIVHLTGMEPRDQLSKPTDPLLQSVSYRRTP